MKTLKEYLVSMDMGVPTTGTHTMLMGDKKDLIHVEFKYNEEFFSHDIKYSEIKADKETWVAKLKSKKYDNTIYEVSGDVTGTGRIGYSINNMVVKVKQDDEVVKEITPGVYIVPANTFIYGTVSKEVIQI